MLVVGDSQVWLGPVEAELVLVAGDSQGGLGPGEGELVLVVGDSQVWVGPVEAELVVVVGDSQVGPGETELVLVVGDSQVWLGPVEAELVLVHDAVLLEQLVDQLLALLLVHHPHVVELLGVRRHEMPAHTPSRFNIGCSSGNWLLGIEKIYT